MADRPSATLLQNIFFTLYFNDLNMLGTIEWE